MVWHPWVGAYLLLYRKAPIHVITVVVQSADESLALGLALLLLCLDSVRKEVHFLLNQAGVSRLEAAPSRQAANAMWDCVPPPQPATAVGRRGCPADMGEVAIYHSCHSVASAMGRHFSSIESKIATWENQGVIETICIVSWCWHLCCLTLLLHIMYLPYAGGLLSIGAA